MASNERDEQSAIPDWASLQTQLLLERSAKVRTELIKGQDVFSEAQVKAMTYEEIVHHVISLRKSRGQPTSVVSMVKNFKPVPFTPDPTRVRKGLDPVVIPKIDTERRKTDDPLNTPIFDSDEEDEVKKGKQFVFPTGTEKTNPAKTSGKPSQTVAAQDPFTLLTQMMALMESERRQAQMLEEKKLQWEIERHKKEEEKEERIRIEKLEQEDRLRKEKLELLKREDEKEEKRLKWEYDRLKREEERQISLNESLIELRQAELRRATRAHELDQQRGARLKRANDMTRGALYQMPSNAADVAPYLTQMDRLFESCQIDPDLRATLLTPYLTDKARRATLAMTVEEVNNYNAWKEAILREHRLTATAYRQQFLNATREAGESCNQFATKLSTMLHYYLAARKVTNFKELVSLILSDRLRDSLHPNSRFHVQDREHTQWMAVSDMAQLVDLYEVARGFDQKVYTGERQYQKGREIRERDTVKAVNFVSTEKKENKTTKLEGNAYKPMNGSWRERIVCYKCSRKGHLAKECRSTGSEHKNNNNEENRRAATRYCYICKNNKHWTRFCQDRLQDVRSQVCWVCGDAGHKARECPKDKKPSNEEVKKSIRKVTVQEHLTKELERRTFTEKHHNDQMDSLPLEGFVNLGGVISPFICDSGAEISVINYSMLPSNYSQTESSGTYVNLQSAWGDLAKAELFNIPARIVQGDSEKGVESLICCAVTNKLYKDTALLTLEDVRTLKDANASYIPQVEVITGTHVRYTDPHGPNDQMVRRVEENIISRTRNTIGLPIFKPLDIAPLQLTEKETLEKFSEVQRQDATLKSAWEQTKETNTCFYESEINGLLYRKMDLNSTVISQLVLPVEYRDQVIFAAHDALWSLHFGHKKTSKRIQLYFWWPGLDSQVKKYVKSCKQCQSTSRKTKLDRVPIGPVERGAQAFDIIHIDLIGPMPIKSSRGHVYVLCAVCSLTRWPMAVPLKSLSAKELCDALITLFSTCGIPRIIISDNGTNMVSGLTQEVYNRLGIELRTSTTYHPEGNAIVERFNQSLKKMLHHIMTSENSKDWDRKLPFLLWSYRELPNATTGVSPYMMVFGQTPKGPLSVLRDKWSGDKNYDRALPRNVQEYLDKLKKDLQVCHEAAAENAKEAETGYIHQYNTRSKVKTFEVGDLVLILMPDNSHKLLSKWMGPGTITAVLSENTYRVALDSGAVKELHANLLRKFISRVNSLGVVFEDDQEFGKIEVYPEDIREFDKEIEQVDLSHLEESARRELKDLLIKHQKVFSTKPGHCKVMEHEINLEEGFKAKQRKQYRIPEKLKADVEKQIDKLLADGKVRYSNSEYAHPIIAVNKPDGSVRLCTDLRMVNSGTINCAYPAVVSEDILMRVSGSSYITTLDCTAGYWQIPMKESDIHKTAFHSSRGLLEWVYMPFGLKTASATFQKAMDIVLCPHSHYAAAYIDDVITFSQDWKAHLSHIDAVLTAIGDAGMTLKLAKCNFAKPRVQYIGHIVGSGKRSVVASKIQAILDIPEPRNKKLLRSFLGMCSFYRAYICNFAEISVPLTDLTKKRASDKIRLNDRERVAFQELKKAISEATTLYTPDQSKPYTIRTDASDYAVGAVLSQVNEEGREFPIAFASSKLNGPQLNWSTIEKEAYAIIYAMTKFDYLVFGREIHLYTDHNPLQYLAFAAPKSAKLTRWALSLSRYDIRIHHIAGPDNVAADCLSRCVEYTEEI